MSTLDEIRNSYGKYYLALNPTYKYYAYQQEKIVPKIEAVDRGEIKKLAIFLPPGESKSDLTTRNYAPFYLGKRPENNVMVCSYGSDLASDDFGMKIKQRMTHPLQLRLFPNARLTKDSRSKTHFSTIKGGNFYSVGYTGGITGKRLDLMILDDLIKNWEEAESDTVQNALFDTYTGVILDRLKPGAAIIMCAHTWTQRDVYHRILEREGRVENGGDWTVLTLPAEDPVGSGVYLWEEYHGKKHYEDFKKADDKIWWGKFQQNPGGFKKGRMFKDEWLRFHDLNPSPGQYNAYLLCDPGGSKNKKSDKTSVQLFLALDQKRLLLADWINDRLDPGERQAKLEKMINYWTPAINLYEEMGMVSDSFFFNRASEEKGFDAVLTPVGRKGPRHLLSKEQRIEGLQPRYREGRIILPRSFFYTNSSGEKIDLTKRFLDQEYNAYMGKGSVAHEDDLDCQSRLDDIEPPYGPGFEWYIPEDKRAPRPTPRGAQSWEVAF